MKRLLFLLLLIPVLMQGQTFTMEAKLIGPFALYRGPSSTANMKVAFWQCLSADAKQTRAGTGFIGKKYPIIIGHHGIGERTSSYSSMASLGTGDLGFLRRTNLPMMLDSSNDLLYNKRYAIQGQADSTSFCYVFPQVWQGHSYTYPAYTYHMIRYIKDSLSDIIDTNRIYLAGLSLGGGGVIYALQDTNILKDVAGAIANCPGYVNPSLGGLPFNFRAMSRWGGLLILTHSTNDSITDKHPTTREGSYYSDRVRDSLNKWKGITTLIYKRWITGGHNVWDRAYSPTNANRTDYPQSNGQNGNFAVNFHVYLLSFSKQGRRMLTDYYGQY